jgi:hypothetical protein
LQVAEVGSWLDLAIQELNNLSSNDDIGALPIAPPTIGEIKMFSTLFSLTQWISQGTKFGEAMLHWDSIKQDLQRGYHCLQDEGEKDALRRQLQVLLLRSKLTGQTVCSMFAQRFVGKDPCRGKWFFQPTSFQLCCGHAPQPDSRRWSSCQDMDSQSLLRAWPSLMLATDHQHCAINS